MVVGARKRSKKYARHVTYSLVKEHLSAGLSPRDKIVWRPPA